MLEMENDGGWEEMRVGNFACCVILHTVPMNVNVKCCGADSTYGGHSSDQSVASAN